MGSDHRASAKGGILAQMNQTSNKVFPNHHGSKIYNISTTNKSAKTIALPNKMSDGSTCYDDGGVSSGYHND